MLLLPLIDVSVVVVGGDDVTVYTKVSLELLLSVNA